MFTPNRSGYHYGTILGIILAVLVIDCSSTSSNGSSSSSSVCNRLPVNLLSTLPLTKAGAPSSHTRRNRFQYPLFAFLSPKSLTGTSTSSRSFQHRRRLSAWLQQKQRFLGVSPLFSKSDNSVDSQTAVDNENNNDETKDLIGLYRPFVQHAWDTLQQSELFTPELHDKKSLVPNDLSSNVSPAKGLPSGSVVRIETRAMIPPSSSNSGSSDGVLRYARYALLETLVPKETNADDGSNNSTSGIQVMNLVVFPSFDTSLPVWGVDLVSLPGGRHLLAMDVQPMTKTPPAENQNDKDDIELLTKRYFEPWYDTYVKNIYEWGGDIPDDASNYFSKYALWTRFKDHDNDDNSSNIMPTTVIQTQIYDIFCKHLDLYISMIKEYKESTGATSSGDIDVDNDNTQKQYIKYRLKNDPARPMLQSLYGPDWTERVLEEVLFPTE